MSEIRLIHGDAPDVLRGLLDASVDAVVTDPPYELGFMGKAWDASGVAFRADLWREVLRVANPGAHLLAFGGARTYHRMACAIEDAGWEVRDSIHWLYGSGFPKSLNIGAGRGTALKPAHEPIIMARKPFRGTVAANVAAHGTGALNVDACRLPVCESTKRPSGVNVSVYGRDDRQGMERGSDSGRWPPNVVFTHAPGCEQVGVREVRGDSRPGGDGTRPGGFADVGSDSGNGRPVGRLYGDTEVPAWNCAPGCPVAALDEQAGERTSGANPTRRGNDKSRGAEVGSASRFFPCFEPDPDAPFLYVPKASRRERERGLDNGNAGTPATHPTVKPIALMQWLVRLVTPPGGTVLDCFAGSGTTGIACLREGRGFLGIEREAEYIEIARARIAAEAPLFSEAI